MKTAIVLLTGALAIATPAWADASAPAAQAQQQNDVRIVVPARNIARGDVIQDSDLTYKKVSGEGIFSGAVTDMRQLVGKQARRFLHVGEPVRTADVRAPILVKKGTTVTMTFHAPGITLTAVGKAMSEGGLGETVTVLNPVSYRQIAATVTGPGTVSAGDISNTVYDGAPTQVAAVTP